MKALPVVLALIAVASLTACDEADGDVPTLRFASAQAAGPGTVVAGDTVRFTRADYDSLLAPGAQLPPFSFEVVPGGVRIDGYYASLSGSGVETEIRREGDVAVIEIGLLDNGNGIDMVTPYVYVAEVAFGASGVRRVRIVHEGDALTDGMAEGRGRRTVVFDRVVAP